MRAGVVAFGLLLTLAGSARAAEEPDGEPILLDGAPGIAEVVAPEGGASGARGAGSLIAVKGFLLTRGPAVRLAFRSAPGRLYQITDEGREVLVGATLAPPAVAQGQDPAGAYVDTLRGVSPADRARLRAVRLVAGVTDAEAQLAGIDLEVAALQVVGPDSRAEAPGLPRGTRHLAFRLDGHFGPADLSPLADLVALRTLLLGALSGEVTDLARLGPKPELQTLDVSARRLSHPEALGRYRSLRILVAQGCEGLTDVTPLAALDKLERLALAFTKVGDLAPLRGLPRLRDVEATACALRQLPAEGFGALRSLRLLCTPVPAAEVEAFRRAHPDCRVVHDRWALLLEAVAGLDRIRVRSGGTCHRQEGRETTIAEVTKPGEIAALLDAFVLDEPDAGGSCMCCGEPTFEFYARGELRASLSFHHGHAVRWVESPWPGDAPLTETSGERLCDWLAARGVPGPREELRQGRLERAAFRRWDLRWRALAGPDLARDIEAVLDATRPDQVEALARLLATRVREPEALALLAFRLIGAAGTRWQTLAYAARDALAGMEAPVLLRAAAHAAGDPEASLGVTCWLYAEPVGRAGLEPLLVPAALRGLGDAAEEVRGLTLDGLAHYRTPAVLALLRGLLDGHVARAPGAVAGGAATTETRANLARVCRALVAHGDRESLPRMRALIATWPADDRQGIEADLGTLEAAGPK